MQISLPEKVTYIIQTIEEAGFQAYAVGGCVRDSILGRCPNDWDITTSAKPMEIKKLFRRTIDTGIQHGTVTVMLDKEGFEVTTYRIDGVYRDGRHPEAVTFTACLEEDLKRRDFTINAMAYNDREGLIDIFGGIRDIENQIVRCVGDPQERFQEDALRMMRAVRFAAQLGYSIEEKTKTAIGILSPNLSLISAERVQAELVKLLLSPNPDMLRVAYETGITKEVLPEFDICMKTEQNNPHHCYSVGEHLLHSLGEVEADRVLRLTMLFHDIGKPFCMTTDEMGINHFKGHALKSREMTHQILRKLKFDNDTLREVEMLVGFHDMEIPEDPEGMRRAMNQVGPNRMGMLLSVKRADLLAQSDYQRQEKWNSYHALQKIYQEEYSSGHCVVLKNLAVTGRTLKEYGVQPGREMGEILDRMLQEVLKNPEHNERKWLLDNLSLFQ